MANELLFFFRDNRCYTQKTSWNRVGGRNKESVTLFTGLLPNCLEKTAANHYPYVAHLNPLTVAIQTARHYFSFSHILSLHCPYLTHPETSAVLFLSQAGISGKFCEARTVGSLYLLHNC